MKADRRGVLLASLVPLALGATSFFLAPTGLAAAVDLLGRWLLGLRPGGQTSYGTWEILYRLLLSEPLLVGFGIAGLIWALLRRDRFGVWAGMAAGVALLVPLLGRGRHPVDLALVVLPLTLLAQPIARTLRPIRQWRDGSRPWLLTTLSLVLLSTAALSLPSAWTPANTAEWRELYTGIGIVTAVLAVLVWVAYGVFGNWRTVGQAVRWCC